MGNAHSLFSCIRQSWVSRWGQPHTEGPGLHSPCFPHFLEKEQNGFEYREQIFSMWVSAAKGSFLAPGHWLILPQGKKQPSFLVHCQATPRESLGLQLTISAMYTMYLLTAFQALLLRKFMLPMSPSTSTPPPLGKISFPFGNRVIRKGFTEW